MRHQLYERFGNWMYALIALGVLVLLALLSWGIAYDSVFMTMLAGALLAVIIVVSGSLLLVPDNYRSMATERTLRMASSTLDHMRSGLTPDGCSAVCQLLLPETKAQAIAMTDTKSVLAYAGEQAPTYPPGTPNTSPTMAVLESGRMETFSSRDVVRLNGEKYEVQVSPESTNNLPVGIIVPLVVAEKPVGTIKLYYRSGREVDRTQLIIARGLSTLLSAQLSSYELDRQAELTARAEVKALQAQINPHFLFNTLNTIAALTRTDPNKARDLLRDFSVFYRRTLEASETLKAGVQARYERMADMAVQEVRVPSFLVQPIVENSVRHAMRDEGPLHIDVHVATDGSDVLIAVADDGLGMDDAVADRLLKQAKAAEGNERGTGIALRNVAERIERFYGVGSGIEIMSRLGEGTVVTLRLADAVPASFQKKPATPVVG